MPASSILVRILQEEEGKSNDAAPIYKSGVYMNDSFQLWKREMHLLRLMDNRKKICVQDILGMVYKDLAKNDDEVDKLTNNGKSKEKLLTYIDENYFEMVPEHTVLDDFDSFQIPITTGFSLCVDAIFGNTGIKCKLLSRSLSSGSCLLHLRRYEAQQENQVLSLLQARLGAQLS
jgi:hypothetical protein